MKSKIIFYLGLTILLAGIGVLSFYSYQSFIRYNKAQANTESIALADKVGAAIRALEKEKIYSAYYLAKEGSVGTSKMKGSRDSTSSAMILLKDTITKSKKKDLLNMTFDTVDRSRLNILSIVDSLSGQYDSLFDGSYTHEVTSPLIKMLKTIEAGSANIYLASYIVLLEKMDRVADEASLVTYITESKAILDKNMVSLWEKMLSVDLTPSLASMPDKAFARSLLVTMKLKDGIALLDELRATVLTDSLYGEYRNGFGDVKRLYVPIVNRLDYARNKILGKIHAEISNNLESSQRELIQYGIGLLVLLALIIYLVKAFGSAAREQAVLEETLKRLVSNMDDERKMEVEHIIRGGDKVSVYRFMYDMIQEARDARKEREEALEAEKTKDLFLANMSHEIRTPLNGIVGFTQLLETTDLNDEQRGFMDIIKVSADNLLSIVNSILDLSKIRANKMDLEAIPFDPVDLFSDAAEPHEVKTSEKKIKYSVFVDPSMPLLIGDPTRLRQVITNLIGNAVKFTDELGAIKLTVEKVKETSDEVSVRFSVKDNGIGITPEQKEKIFDAFTQADSSTTRQFGGTGLGLAITNDLIKHMGGKLEVESQYGLGSEFHFTIPFEKAGDNEAQHDHQLDTLRIAFYCPAECQERRDDILPRYLYAISDNVTEVSELSEDIAKDNDVLFVDHSLAIVRDNFESIMSLGIRVIVIGYISYKPEIDGHTKQYKMASVVYQPINYPKIKRTLESAFVNTEEAEEAQVSSDLDLTGIRVLVAEDNTINQNLIRVVLENLGLVVSMADNGQIAVDMRINNDYDIVLMDIQMPVMGGVEATKKILELEQINNLKHVPIIALTANALQGDREKFIRAGMDDYISKPIQLEQIKTVIEEYCPVTHHAVPDNKTTHDATPEHHTTNHDNHSQETIDTTANDETLVILDDTDDKNDDVVNIDLGDVDNDDIVLINEFDNDDESLDISTITPNTEDAIGTPPEDTSTIPIPQDSIDEGIEVAMPMSDQTIKMDTEDQSNTTDVDTGGEQGGARSALLYCDGKMIQMLHSKVLKNAGYEVDLAGSEDEFLTKFDQTKHDVVILSSKMVPDSIETIIESIEESGARPMLYTADSHLQEQFGDIAYSKMDVFRDKLTK